MSFKLTTSISMVCATLCLIPACKQDTEDESNTPITNVTNKAQYNALYSRFAELYCACEIDSLPIYFSYLGDKCEDVILLEFSDDRADILDGIQNGRLQFNLENYQCLESALSDPTQCFQRGQCETNVEDRLFSPLVEIGGDCLLDDECIDGYCSNEDDSQYLCTLGTCTAYEPESEEEIQDVYVMEGERCGQVENTYYVCNSPTLGCDEERDQPVCAPKREVEDGQPCNNSLDYCRSSSWCLPSSDEEDAGYICKALGQLNDECSRIQVCDLSLYCEYTNRDMPGVCRQRDEAGEACTGVATGDFDEQSCVIGSECYNELCYPTRFEGEPCDLDEQCNGHTDMICVGGVCAKDCN